MNLKLIKLLQPPLVNATLRRPSFLPPLVVPPFIGPRPERMPPWMTTGRSRPRYFDGRFLAARDLERDQAYVAARQAEYLRAAGAGIIHGLRVEQRDHATVRVTAGAAITTSGHAVVLRQQHDLTLGDGAATQKLDRDLGLSRTPRELARRGTGIYALLARPVEYTANPIGFYPASIEERRRPEDGEVIDAVAFTLVPFHDPAVDVEPARQRASLARRLFVERADTGLPVDAVPLAMLQLERGFVRWVDPWLVRREIGDAYDGMGAQRRGARAIAEAQVHQYHQHLGVISGERAGETFAATDALTALPPAGGYPRSALDVIARADRFFPPSMPLSLHVVPHDELPVLVDEALALPPIDLAADRAALGAVPIAIVVGLARRQVETLPPRLRRFRLKSAASNIDVSADGTGSTERLAELLAGPLTHVPANPAVCVFIRQRRAIGDTEEGVLRVERQAVG